MKQPFRDPETLVNILFENKDKLLEMLTSQSDKEALDKKMMKFVCEFIMDSYDQDDKPSCQLMLEIFKKLITVDSLKRD